MWRSLAGGTGPGPGPAVVDSLPLDHFTFVTVNNDGFCTLCTRLSDSLGGLRLVSSNRSLPAYSAS